MLEIIWIHIRECYRDLRSSRLGNLQYERENTKDMITNDKYRWRVR